MMKFIERHEAATMLATHGFDNVSEHAQSDEWRRFGKIRRLELLKNDRQEGEHIFEINPTVRVDKYFQVINRSLVQFHAMYKDKENCNLEEIYIMGHRIQRFFIEFVPEHPDYSKPRSWQLRNKSRRDVRTLQFCLEEIAILIDEQLCNEVVDFAPEFDGLLLQDQVGGPHVKSSDLSHSSPFDNWVAFGGWHKEVGANDVSLDSRLNTTGSESTVNLDSSLDIEYDVTPTKCDVDGFSERPEGPENMAKAARIVFPLNLSESAEEDRFLSTVASQKFSFELDSDACDSWAQDQNLRPQKAKQFRHAAGNNTCDPAEIMFRHVLKAGVAKLKSAGVRSARGMREEECRGLSTGPECGPKVTIRSALESALDEGKVNTSYQSHLEDDTVRYLNERRFNDRTPPNSGGNNRACDRFEDHYLVAGVESMPGSTPIESTPHEALKFRSFDFKVLAKDEWIDFGDNGIDSF